MNVREAATALGHKYTSRVYDLINKQQLEAVKNEKGDVEVDEASLKTYMSRRDARKEKAATPKAKAEPKERKVRSVPKPSSKRTSKKAKATAHA